MICIVTTRDFAIIADDLTGASDSGVQFASKGIVTHVVLNWEHYYHHVEDARTIVLETDSRSLLPSESYQRVKQTVDKVKEIGFSHVYKKIDSTLRGNLGTEIDAIMDTLEFDVAVIAPAFPKMGRTTVDGTHLVNGIPVHLTEIAGDPKCPVTESNICKLLSSQSRRQATLIPLETLWMGSEAVLEQIHIHRNNGSEMFVFDSVTDDDLSRIADIMVNAHHRVLWVGSAGLADVLPGRLGIPFQTQMSKNIMDKFDKPTLLVAGSLSQVTRQQLEVYCTQLDILSVKLNPISVIHGGLDRERETECCRTLVSNALAQGRDVAFYASSAPEQVEKAQQLGAERGLDKTTISNLIAETLGDVTVQSIPPNGLKGFILTGGDTAKAVCKHLGVAGIELLMELEPGMPLGRAVGGGDQFIVTKAGAFGTKDTLVHAFQVLKGLSINE